MPDEASVCRDCLQQLPYTDFYKSPYDNYLARLFWKQFPIEKASSLFFYYPHANNLGNAPESVKKHVSVILSKIGAATRAEATSIALRLGLLKM